MFTYIDFHVMYVTRCDIKDESITILIEEQKLRLLVLAEAAKNYNRLGTFYHIALSYVNG